MLGISSPSNQCEQHFNLTERAAHVYEIKESICFDNQFNEFARKRLTLMLIKTSGDEIYQIEGFFKGYVPMYPYMRMLEQTREEKDRHFVITIADDTSIICIDDDQRIPLFVSMYSGSQPDNARSFAMLRYIKHKSPQFKRTMQVLRYNPVSGISNHKF